MRNCVTAVGVVVGERDCDVFGETARMVSQERGTHKESTGGGGVVLWPAVVVVAR